MHTWVDPSGWLYGARADLVCVFLSCCVVDTVQLLLVVATARGRRHLSGCVSVRATCKLSCSQRVDALFLNQQPPAAAVCMHKSLRARSQATYPFTTSLLAPACSTCRHVNASAAVCMQLAGNVVGDANRDGLSQLKGTCAGQVSSGGRVVTGVCQVLMPPAGNLQCVLDSSCSCCAMLRCAVCRAASLLQRCCPAPLLPGYGRHTARWVVSLSL